MSKYSSKPNSLGIHSLFRNAGDYRPEELLDDDAFFHAPQEEPQYEEEVNPTIDALEEAHIASLVTCILF